MSPIFSSEEKARILNAYFDAMSDPVPFVPTTLADWNRRRLFLRAQLADLLGLSPFPERLPLDVHVTGERVERDYTISRLYWQSWEGFYASGWLYRPRWISEPVPAILNPHGHWTHGARHPTVQSRLIGLAKRGYIALAVDSVHVVDFPVGLSPMTVMTWNNIRALDLLSLMDEVDASRIGCTGASGGGQQTMYVAALDDRIAATVNVCLVSYFKKILFPSEKTHCFCNHVPGLLAVTDEPEICSLIAPRPSLYLCVTGDWTCHFPREEFPEIAAIYSLFGARHRVAVHQEEGSHDYSRPMRERMYAWFDVHLRGEEESRGGEEPEMTLFSPEELATLSGEVPQARPWEEFPRYYRSLHALCRGPLTREGVRRLLGRDRRRVYVEPDLFVRRGEGVEVVRGEGGVPFPVRIVRPDEASERFLFLLHPQGREAIHSNLTEAFRERQWNVVVPDVRWRGELQIRWELNATVWGRPEVGAATDDVLVLIETYAPRGEVVCVGLGDLGVVALVGAFLDERVRMAIAPELGPSFGGGRTSSIIPHFLRYGDLPDLVAWCRRARIVVGGIPEDEIPLYRKAGAEILTRPDDWWAFLLAMSSRS